MKEKLRYVSSKVSHNLKSSVASNLNRYLAEDFQNFKNEPDWSIELKLEVDHSLFAGLMSSVNDDAQSSKLVWGALGMVSPSLATEGRIWTRLTHVECLEYSRARWIGTKVGEDAEKVILDHFFADTRTGCRDDNAIGRLWWTAYIAYLAFPHDQGNALAAIWKSADIRSNVVERPWISSRPVLAGAIVRAILDKPSVTASEAAFRDFMKTMNAKGGGLLFESMGEKQVDAFIAGCVP